MPGKSLVLAAASEGNPVVGFLILAGIVWFVCWLFSSKPKGYDITSVTHGQIKPR